ncbi:MAG: DEAD/DEAH box helicase family protein [Wolbachia sp.]
MRRKTKDGNNIATGSGKTGDIALLKFWAYLVNIPCITVVPSDNLRTQSNNFDREFLPDEVAREFAESFSETNVEYATTTFAEAFNTEWNVLHNTYGKNKSKPALILIDEAPKLKENAVQMARAVEVVRYNPTVYFSATPDKFLSEELKIKRQILLSPKEREALGIGKLPVFYVAKKGIYSISHRVNNLPNDRPRKAEEQYVKKYENTHLVLDQLCFLKIFYLCNFIQLYGQ